VQSGELEQGRRWLQQAEQSRAQLLPSERALLRDALLRNATSSLPDQSTPVQGTASSLNRFPAAALSGATMEN
jgi:hypothetical protein